MFNQYRHWMETGQLRTHDGSKLGSDSFEARLYLTIMRADMHNRLRLWLSYPQQVNEVMVYEGHKPFDHSTQISIEELCGIHNWEVDPADIEYMLGEPTYRNLVSRGSITLADDDE